MLCVSGSKREKYDLSYSSDNDLSSLVKDAESQMARLVAKVLRVCNGLVILTYSIWQHRLLLLSMERCMSFDT